MSKVFVVARHEFFTTVKRIGFLVVTFGLPLFMAGVMGLTMLTQKSSMREDRSRIEAAVLGVVDESGLLTRPVPDRVTWKRYATAEEGRRRMTGDQVEILVRIPPDYVKSGEIERWTTIRPTLFNAQDAFVPFQFQEYLVQCVLAGQKPEHIVRAQDPVVGNRITFLQEGTAEDVGAFKLRLLTAGFFFMLTFMSISVAGGYLIQGMADEKENRVLEMVISSVSPMQLMAGKLIGLGAVGLLQVAVWSALGVTSAILMLASFALNPGLFAFCACFYLLGYLLYGSLLLGIGSLGSNQRESMQYTWVVSIITMAPLFVLVSLLGAPQSTMARVFTFIPLTAPTTMILRYSIDPKGTPTWEIVATALILIGSVLLALKVSSRLYRVGLLLYGKRPTPREIWRWIRSD